MRRWVPGVDVGLITFLSAGERSVYHIAGIDCHSDAYIQRLFTRRIIGLSSFTDELFSSSRLILSSLWSITSNLWHELAVDPCHDSST